MPDSHHTTRVAPFTRGQFVTGLQGIGPAWIDSITPEGEDAWVFNVNLARSRRRRTFLVLPEELPSIKVVPHICPSIETKGTKCRGSKSPPANRQQVAKRQNPPVKTEQILIKPTAWPPRESVLNSTIIDILQIADAELDTLLSKLDNISIHSLGLTDDETRRICAHCYYPEDPATHLLCTSIDNWITAGFEEHTFAAVSKAIRAASPGCAINQLYASLSQKTSSSPLLIFPDTLIQKLGPFLLTSPLIPNALVAPALGLGFRQWSDLAHLQERDIADQVRGRLWAKLSAIQVCWSLRLYAEGVADLWDREGFPNTTSFSQMVQTFAHVCASQAATSREQGIDETIIRARLGIDGGKETLENTSRKVFLTRERVRQRFKDATSKLSDRPRKFWLAIDEVINGGGGICHLDQVITGVNRIMNWKNNTDAATFRTFLEMQERITYDPESGLVTNTCSICLGCQKAMGKVRKLLAQHKQGVPLQQIRVQVNRFCHDAKCIRRPAATTLTPHFIQAMVSKTPGYIVDGDCVYPEKIWREERGGTYHRILELMRDTRKPMHNADIYEALAERDPDLKLNMIQSALTYRDEFLLWGPGIYVLREATTIPMAVMKVAAAWLERKLLSSGAPFIDAAGAYHAHYTKLTSAGIPTKQAFYSCLRCTFAHRLKFPRYPRVVLAQQEVISVVQAIEKFAFEAGTPIPIETLLDYGREHLLMRTIANHLQKCTNIIPAGPGYVVHSQHARPSSKRRQGPRTHSQGVTRKPCLKIIQAVSSKRQR